MCSRRSTRVSLPWHPVTASCRAVHAGFLLLFQRVHSDTVHGGQKLFLGCVNSASSFARNLEPTYDHPIVLLQTVQKKAPCVLPPSQNVSLLHGGAGALGDVLDGAAQPHHEQRQEGRPQQQRRHRRAPLRRPHVSSQGSRIAPIASPPPHLTRLRLSRGRARGFYNDNDFAPASHSPSGRGGGDRDGDARRWDIFQKSGGGKKRNLPESRGGRWLHWRSRR